MSKPCDPVHNNHGCYITGDTLNVDLWYPRIDPVKAIQVGLVDVRAADDIRVEYDYDRNGWVVKQATEDDAEDWQEVAFVKAYSRRAPST